MPRASKKVSKEISVDPEKCRYMTRSRAKKILNEKTAQKGQTGPSGCSMKQTSTASRKGKVGTGVGNTSNRPADRRSVSPVMPKLVRSPPIISSPVQPTTAGPSTETRCLQAIATNHETRLKNLEGKFDVLTTHVTEVLPAHIDRLNVTSNAEFQRLREQMFLECQDCREKIAEINQVLRQPVIVQYVEVHEEGHEMMMCANYSTT